MKIFQPIISGSLSVVNTPTASIIVQTLPTSSTVTNVVLYDSASGQLYYTASSGIGGGSGNGVGFPFSGSAIITGSLLVSGSGLIVTGSIEVMDGGITGSLLGTASWAYNALTASFAPDYVLNSVTNSFVFTSQTGSFITSAQTSSFVTTDQTSSFVRNEQTSSFLTTGSQNVVQTISGSLTILENLVVLGSSSVTYISSSNLNIGTNLITVNTFNPTNRYGGLGIIDSGSNPLISASFLYDSLQDEFIFVHKGDGTNITSSHFLVGPQTYNKLGDEEYITANRLLKSQGNEHVTSSNITDDETNVSINSNTRITGSLNVSAGITGSLFGTASFATNTLTSSYPIASNGNTLYSTAPISTYFPNTSYNIFLGFEAGSGSGGAENSNFIGYQSGKLASTSSNSNFIGIAAGAGAFSANYSNFIGRRAGYESFESAQSNFIGNDTGYNAYYANNSNFIGNKAGYTALSASYSTFIGYKAGFYKNISDGIIGVKSNNIIIGNNIGLPDGRQNSINIGGILFGTGLYSVITDENQPAYTGSTDGRIGINVVSPNYNFEVSGTVSFPNLVTGSSTNVVMWGSNGQLFITASTAILGVTSIIAGSGISVNKSSGDVTITNTGQLTVGQIIAVSTGMSNLF